MIVGSTRYRPWRNQAQLGPLCGLCVARSARQVIIAARSQPKLRPDSKLTIDPRQNHSTCPLKPCRTQRRHTGGIVRHGAFLLEKGKAGCQCMHPATQGSPSVLACFVRWAFRLRVRTKVIGKRRVQVSHDQGHGWLIGPNHSWKPPALLTQPPSSQTAAAGCVQVMTMALY